MEQQAFEVGKKYRKEEILERFREFEEVDFTDSGSQNFKFLLWSHFVHINPHLSPRW